MRTAFVATVFLLLCACGREREESQIATSLVEAEGESLPVQSDPRATYQLVHWSEMHNGHLEAITRRDGSSGTSYARREIDCARKQFRYLGEGDTRQEAEADAENIGKMADLVPGSISSEVSEYVCAK